MGDSKNKSLFFIGIGLLLLSILINTVLISFIDNNYLEWSIFVLSGVLFFVGLILTNFRLDKRYTGCFLIFIGLLVFITGILVPSTEFVLSPIGFYVLILGLYWTIFIKKNNE